AGGSRVVVGTGRPGGPFRIRRLTRRAPLPAARGDTGRQRWQTGPQNRERWGLGTNSGEWQAESLGVSSRSILGPLAGGIKGGRRYPTFARQNPNNWRRGAPENPLPVAIGLPQLQGEYNGIAWAF